MKLWLIKGVLGHPKWRSVRWGRATEFVVRAETEAEVRQSIVNGEFFGQEGADVWLDPETSTCSELTADGDAGIVLSDLQWQL